MAKKQSAGLLLFRRVGPSTEVLLGHPGGPFWRKRDEGAWTIPKGEAALDEPLLAAARREFEEETGHHPVGEPIELGEARQAGGKLVHVWAAEDGWDTTGFHSNTFELQWPPKSGRLKVFPEIDRVEWFIIASARRKIFAGQMVFINRLEELLGAADD